MSELSAPPYATIADLAVFLDVDGTLLEIAPTPESVRVSDSVKILLSDLSLQLKGALALVSGAAFPRWIRCSIRFGSPRRAFTAPSDAMPLAS